ncbi:G-protein coupled receptor family C group 6 member A-like [Bombina bombina]|uniref:G-protein coupled receptor family C group 6 member A-like n=1 Tax=Bombina bombina TaxID=8345 RepID=UPI00235B1837|nr:G-protein coupled receptor family C group 6 member A-like [Bombina bombina]
MHLIFLLTVYSEAFIFAIDEINMNPDLLPNITLGYQLYDSCSDEGKAIENVIRIMHGATEAIPNYDCWSQGKLAGFIGDLTSVTTMAASKMLGMYGYTQITYGATDLVFNNKLRFPTFFRSLPSNIPQYEAMAELLLKFGWNWVGIITSDDDSGEEESRELEKVFTTWRICIEYIESTHTVHYNYNYDILINTIKKSTSQIIIICGNSAAFSYFYVSNIFQEIANKTFIFLASIIPYDFDITNYDPRNGSLAFEFYGAKIPGLTDIFKNIRATSPQHDMFLEGIFAIFVSCVTTEVHWEVEKQLNFTSGAFPPLRNCTKNTNLSSFESLVFDINNFRITYNVYNAVYMMAHAIHEMHRSTSAPEYRWKVPRGVCSESCGPGFYKTHKKGVKHCCHDCVRCAKGEISNTSDMEICTPCPEDEWPNEKQDRCLPKDLDFLSYGDLIGKLLSFFSVLLCSLTVAVIVLFIRHRDTPIVKANNRDLSFVLLFSLMLSFLCALLFIGKPEDLTCMLRQTSFGIIFSVSVSSLLAKTIMVVIAFTVTRPGSRWRKWMGNRISYGVVIMSSLLQVLICGIWLSMSPPFKDVNMNSEIGKIVIECNEGSLGAFISVLGYLGLLAGVSFTVAFLARTLPDSFNEAKYITFSMLVFCSVWVSFIPAYLSTKGKYMVAVQVFAILASGTGLLGCIFVPKCYIIVLRPELNTKEQIIGKSAVN